MLLGIRKIEYIYSKNLYDYSYLAPGSSLNIDRFIKTGCHFTALPFTIETGELSEQWLDNEQGKHSKVSFAAAIRKNKDAFKNTLQALLGRKCVYKITLVSGIEYIIGSPEYVPVFTYSDAVSGISSSEFTFNIENESIHGLLVNSAE